VEEAGEFLGQHDPAFAKAKVLDTLFVRLAAQVFGQSLFQPVGGVDDQGLERMLLLRELGDRGGDFLPGGRGVESGHVEVVGAAFGVEEDGFRQTACQRRFADAFGSVNDGLSSDN
jgi:hypothetical protein